jgi:hypothetical protein
MKEFCIEINEAQPLEKVEAKLKELGYTLYWNIPGSKRQPKFISTDANGTYDVYRFSYDGESPLLTLDEL